MYQRLVKRTKKALVKAKKQKAAKEKLRAEGVVVQKRLRKGRKRP